MSRARLLERLEQRWNDLLESYAGLSEADMAVPGVVGRWSVKDLVAHVSAWEEESLKHVPAILAGRRPPRYSVTYGGIDAFNAQAAERVRDLPLAEVLRRRDATHRRLLGLIAGLPGESLVGETRVRRRLRLDAYGHYPTHAGAIRRWRERRRDGGGRPRCAERSGSRMTTNGEQGGSRP